MVTGMFRFQCIRELFHTENEDGSEDGPFPIPIRQAWVEGVYAGMAQDATWQHRPRNRTHVGIWRSAENVINTAEIPRASAFRRVMEDIKEYKRELIVQTRNINMIYNAVSSLDKGLLGRGQISCPS